MAIAIKQIPVLGDKDARRFQEKAEAAFRARKPMDFSKQIESADKILAKSRIN